MCHLCSLVSQFHKKIDLQIITLDLHYTWNVFKRNFLLLFPTDPPQTMYCHEMQTAYLGRIWIGCGFLRTHFSNRFHRGKHLNKTKLVLQLVVLRERLCVLFNNIFLLT